MEMLTIRKAQMEALARGAREHFVDRAVQHIARVLPERFGELGPDKVRHSVQHALAKADRYGLTREFDVLRLLNFMYVFGFDADTDPQYPWAAEILTDKRFKPATKVDFLMLRAECMVPENHG